MINELIANIARKCTSQQGFKEINLSSFSSKAHTLDPDVLNELAERAISVTHLTISAMDLLPESDRGKLVTMIRNIIVG